MATGKGRAGFWKIQEFTISLHIIKHKYTTYSNFKNIVEINYCKNDLYVYWKKGGKGVSEIHTG